MDSKIEEVNFDEPSLLDLNPEHSDTLDQIKTLFLTSQIRYNTQLNKSFSKIEGDEIEVYSGNEDDDNQTQVLEMQEGNIQEDIITQFNVETFHDDYQNIQEVQIQDIHNQYEENNKNIVLNKHVVLDKHVVLQGQKKVNDDEDNNEKKKGNVKFQRQNEINVSELYNNDQQALMYEKKNSNNVFQNQNKNYAQDQKALQKIRDIHRQYMGIKEGYLYKKSNGIMGMFEKRFFILTNSRFFFFKDDKKLVVNGVINFKVAKCSVINKKDKLFSVAIEDYKNHYHLRASTNQEASDWFDLIQCVISENKQKKAWIMTRNLKMYLEADSLTEEELIDFAETGDILLFTTNHIAAKLQRDHVGMLIKFDQGDIRVFDSSQDTGVALLQWDEYIQSNDLFQQVVVRKLVYNRRLEIEPLLIQFVGETLGKKYLLTAQKLLKRKSFGRRSKEEGYFCSELIAKALKQSKLLDPIKSSCQYWPVDFSQEKQLQLQNGAKLSNEITIILQKHRYL